MTKAPQIIIYGCALQAQQLRNYIEMENQGNIAAYVVDDVYKKENLPDIQQINGLPLICFSEMLANYAPQDVMIANSLAYSHMVEDRERVHRQCKANGYQMFTFLSKASHVYAAQVGEGTIIYPGCTIGHNVILGEGNFFEIGATIAHDSVIGSFNFFAPNAIMCGGIHMEHNCFVGAGAVIINGGIIKHHALIAAGTVVRNAEAESVYFAPRAVKWHGESSDIKI